MSRFQDPYLAESSGFATGHSNGIAQGVEIGRQQGFSDGYTEGWNAAAAEANVQLSKKDTLIAELKTKIQNNSESAKKEINKIDADREKLAKEIFALIDRINLLRARNDETTNTLEKIKSLKDEEKNNYNSKYEEKHMAFLGAAAIARAAMKIVEKAHEKEKSEFLSYYASCSIDLQTEDYIDKNDFPHDQEIIKNHLPDINDYLNKHLIPQVVSYREDLK